MLEAILRAGLPLKEDVTITLPWTPHNLKTLFSPSSFGKGKAGELSSLKNTY